MSSETYQWLAENVLAGFVDARPPWWLAYATAEGFATNTWPTAVPMDEVIKLIASWEPIPETLYTADMQLVPSHKAYRASDSNVEAIARALASSLIAPEVFTALRDRPGNLPVSLEGALLTS